MENGMYKVVKYIAYGATVVSTALFSFLYSSQVAEHTLDDGSASAVLTAHADTYTSGSGGGGSGGPDADGDDAW